MTNAISGDAIGSRTPGFKTNADGSIDIYLQGRSPGADTESDWLPTPQKGPYYMVLAHVRPQGSLAAGSWLAPQPTVGYE